MPVPLPNLDDRRWSDLVDEGRALIPLYARDWTDHNVHDPGIMLMELFAWIAEMDIYQLNRIPDLHKRKFLELVGVEPRPPLAAHVVLVLERKNASGKLLLPANTEFYGADPGGISTPFHTLHDISIVPAKVQAIQSLSNGAYVDQTDVWKRKEPVAIFGAEPTAGAALYLGFTQVLPIGDWVNLHFRFSNMRSDEVERNRLLKETAEQSRLCLLTPPGSCGKKDSAPPVHQPKPATLPDHHSVRTTWEFLSNAGAQSQWRPLTVDDSTRSFTLSGFVRVRVSAAMAKAAVGKVEAPLYYLRCRMVSGSYDAEPVSDRIEINAVAAEQSVPVSKQWKINRNTVTAGSSPAPGDRTSLQFAFDAAGKITELKFPADDPEAPKFLVLEYKAASSTDEGVLTLALIRAGVGTGSPYQAVSLLQNPVSAPSFWLFTLEGGSWKTWASQPELSASRADDLHYVLDASRGTVTFGNGEEGRVPPPEAMIFAAYNVTRAELGNLGVGAIQALLDSPRNRSLLGDVSAVRSQLATIMNSTAASGGAAAETLIHTIGRAVALREARLRAVTTEDYEFLARETPGVHLARVTAKANHHPSFPCLQAPGLVTVLALPYLPLSRPFPSGGLRRAVHAYLQRRRIIGTRIEVVGPSYREVRVQAQVRALDGTSKTRLQQKVVSALNEFLHPLRGGPDGTGWPFGRDVYRSEIMQVIDQVPGVDHVVSLALLAGGCDPQCGNVCLGPEDLVATGQHEIQMV